jgi:tetratricopeptide (TPR) repeat protein
MSQKQRQRQQPTAAHQAASSNLLRRIVPVLLVLVAVALLASAYLWWNRPSLEPLPVVALESLSPRAEELIQRAAGEVQINDHSAAAWGALGSVLRAHDFGEEAEVCFRNAHRLDDADYRWPYLLGVSLAPRDDERALSFFRLAAQRGRNQPHVQLRLAEMLIDRRLYDEAAELVEQALRAAPDDPRGQLAQARLLFAEGKLEEARSWATKSAAGARDRRAPHLLLAQLCRRTGDKAGEADALEILATIPDGITPWEDPDVADMLALRQDGGTADTVVEMARSLSQQRRFDAAAAALRNELKKSPANERLHFELGVACYRQEQFQQAAAAFRRAIELKADYVDAHYNLGHTLLRRGEKEQARDAFAATVRLRPGHVFARINLADLLLQAGETKAAREHLEVAVKLAPGEQTAQELLRQASRADD